MSTMDRDSRPFTAPGMTPGSDPGSAPGIGLMVRTSGRHDGHDIVDGASDQSPGGDRASLSVHSVECP